MKKMHLAVLAAALIGFGWVSSPNEGLADSGIDARQELLKAACEKSGGRFEQSWQYNDQGTQWGAVASCTTTTGHVTCLDGICRGRRLDGRAVGSSNRGEGLEDSEAGSVDLGDVLAILVQE